MPTIPERILELTGITEGFGDALGLVAESGEAIGVDLSHTLAATASVRAL